MSAICALILAAVFFPEIGAIALYEGLMDPAIDNKCFEWVYWNKESYWCTDDVLSSIENGTFLENIQDGGALHSGGWWHYT